MTHTVHSSVSAGVQVAITFYLTSSCFQLRGMQTSRLTNLYSIKIEIFVINKCLMKVESVI